LTRPRVGDFEVAAGVGDADIVAGPRRSHAVRAYAPDEIEKIVLEGAVGSLLVRVAAACGYQVGISLEPLSPGMRAFSTVLRGTTR